jgi:hypothetical protein
MRKKGLNRKTKVTWILFLIPIMITSIFVFYGIIISYLQPKFGTLIIKTIVLDNDQHKITELTVSVAVDGSIYRSPVNISLAPGLHKVSFFEVMGYRTPLEKFVNVLPGKEAYAIGVYTPVEFIINITKNKIVFTNITNIAIIHGVTPVVFVNVSDEPVQLGSYLFDSPVLAPHQNYTKIFESPGLYRFWILGNSSVSSEIYVS